MAAMWELGNSNNVMIMNPFLLTKLQNNARAWIGFFK
jgi:hypothetical protein